LTPAGDGRGEAVALGCSQGNAGPPQVSDPHGGRSPQGGGLRALMTGRVEPM
jgi:hypothetical protein